MLKIILAEDHKLVRDGIKMLLETADSFEIIAEVSNGQDVMDFLAGGGEADVVLADISMPLMDGMTMLAAIKKQYPRLKVTFLSMLDDLSHIAKMFNQGASGYLLKNTSADELIFAIKHICTGERYVSAEVGLHLLGNYGQDRRQITENDIEFSERELEILHLIAEGHTNLEIADRLFISKRTVEGHRQSLLEKTGSRNTATLIRTAINWRLIV